MNENMKSLVFVGIALVVGVAAFFSRPRATTLPDTPPEKVLFADFKDPATARSLEVIRLDEASSTIQTFKVQQENGLWVIPSSGNYPADARDRIQTAATTLIGLEVIGVATDKQNEHEVYGVVQPDAGKEISNLKGVGTMISVKDAAGKSLASLIIGKSPKGQPNQHFVRQPSQDRVYVTKVDPSQVSTKFEDWIEKDLLNLNPLDVNAIEINNYSLVPTRDPSGRTGLAMLPKADLSVNFDEKLNQWTPGKMTVYVKTQKKMEEKAAPLTEQEELNSAKLDELRTALDNLQIAGVRRKPPGFTADLKAEKSFADNQEAQQSLMEKGFFTNPGKSGELEIYGTSGAMKVFGRDGVQYDLRFGEIDQAEKGKVTTDINRYMLVSVSLNQAALPPPNLEEEPAGPEAPKKEGEKTPEGQQKPDDVAAEAKLAQEKERIKKENERKTSEYAQKLSKAKNRVRELNYRFADWYYLVSDETFKKLSLSRSDIVREGASSVSEGFGIDAFRAMERQGIKPPPPMPRMPSGGPPGGPPGGPFGGGPGFGR